MTFGLLYILLGLATAVGVVVHKEMTDGVDAVSAAAFGFFFGIVWPVAWFICLVALTGKGIAWVLRKSLRRR